MRESRRRRRREKERKEQGRREKVWKKQVREEWGEKERKKVKQECEGKRGGMQERPTEREDICMCHCLSEY